MYSIYKYSFVLIVIFWKFL